MIFHTYLTYNQEKAIVAAFSVIVKSSRTFFSSSRFLTEAKLIKHKYLSYIDTFYTCLYSV